MDVPQYYIYKTTGMKNYLFNCIMILMLNSVFAQDGDAIVGKWQSEHGSGTIQIYRNQDKYYGRLVAIKDQHDKQGKPQMDINNPSEKLRSRPVVGMEILKDLQYKGNGVWDNGTLVQVTLLPIKLNPI